MPPRFTTSDVRRYYDRQTSGFVALGQGAGAIHRAVWGPGVTEREQAFHFVDDRIAQLILDLPQRNGSWHIVDLGCGVGSSLCYLAGRTPVRGTGVTLSPVQADLGSRRVRALGLSDRVSVVEGDYGALPAAIVNADLAYAIESFVHAPDPRAFFSEASRILEPSGLLVICDDVSHAPPGGESSRAIDQFRRGWHINSLLEPEALETLARQEGFTRESTLDLTSWLEINRPRDRAIAAFLTLFGWLPLERTRFAHLAGGRALQECLRQGWIRYELNVFRKHSPTSHRRPR